MKSSTSAFFNPNLPLKSIYDFQPFPKMIYALQFWIYNFVLGKPVSFLKGFSPLFLCARCAKRSKGKRSIFEAKRKEGKEEKREVLKGN